MLSESLVSATAHDFLLLAISILLLALFVGLGRAFIGPSVEDRFSSLLLLGSAGVAIIIILAVVMANAALYDVGLVLALLAVVVTVALTRREHSDE